jgi:hypothetical protein
MSRSLSPAYFLPTLLSALVSLFHAPSALAQQSHGFTLYHLVDPTTKDANVNTLTNARHFGDVTRPCLFLEAGDANLNLDATFHATSRSPCDGHLVQLHARIARRRSG